jgi:hypothetical protein
MNIRLAAISFTSTSRAIDIAPTFCRHFSSRRRSRASIAAEPPQTLLRQRFRRRMPHAFGRQLMISQHFDISAGLIRAPPMASR